MLKRADRAPLIGSPISKPSRRYCVSPERAPAMCRLLRLSRMISGKATRLAARTLELGIGKASRGEAGRLRRCRGFSLIRGGGDLFLLWELLKVIRGQCEFVAAFVERE